MDEAQQEQLFGLMAVAQEQQQAVEAAVAGLAAERAALAKERAALAQATASVVDGAGEVRRAAAAVTPAAQKAAGEAVSASVRQALAGAAQTAASALGEATRPVVGNLSSAAEAAAAAAASIRNAGQWFAWKWVAVAAGGVVGLGLLAYAAVAWQMHQVERLSEQRAALAAEVARLQASVAALERRGGKIVLNNCGGRLCIEASGNQGEGFEQWKGAVWNDKGKGVQLVIPRGY